MPASSAEVIGVALQSAYRDTPVDTAPSSLYKKNHLEEQLVASSKQVLLNHVEYDRVGTQQSLVLSSLKTKYVNLTASDTTTPTSPSGSMAHARHKPSAGAKEDQLEEPRVVLWPRDKVTLGWRKTFSPGAGMVNLGNTCYMNSSLQALFHIPSMANWLMDDLSTHTQRCESISGNASFCSVCAMMRTFRSTLDRSNTVIKPSLIQHKLKSIGKTLMYGRQEDAHEFIKLLLDHMEKSYLTFRKAMKLDHRSKETTPLNQIFGGYIRQQVICPVCHHVSTTFSHFQDLVLDIRSVNSVDDALNLHFKKETLDVDNAYKCEKCLKKVPATKRHLIERAPHVLLIQLKRFTMSGGKIGKHINIQRTIDISRFVNGASKHQPGTGPYQYRLASMVIHLGGSQHGGHYTAVAEASSGTMFEFDDSSVRSISVQSALLRNPYILFYEMVRKPKDNMQVKQVVRQSSEKTLIRQNSDGVSKPIPTSHSASSVANGFGRATDNIGEVGNRNGIPTPTNKPPLPSHKDRERISFGIKLNQGKSESTNKPNRIILNAGTTSLLIMKPSASSSGSSSSTSTPSKTVSTPKSVPSLVPYPDDSDESEIDESKGGSVKAHREKSVQNNKVKSDDPRCIKANGVKSAKSEKINGLLHVQKPERLSNGDVKNNKCTESDSSIKSNISSKSGTTTFMPRSLQVVNSTTQHYTAAIKASCKGKSDSGWLVTDASLHSPSESSNSSAGGSHGNLFTVVDQPTSCKLEQKQPHVQVHEKPENQGWTVTPKKQRPELEKSLSHDSVLPSPTHKKDEADSASLKSKASVDSCRSDRSTKSMKKSILSLFTCVSSRSPESPEDEQPEAVFPQRERPECNKLKSTDGCRIKGGDIDGKVSKSNSTSNSPNRKECKKELLNESNKNGINCHSENGHHSSKSDTDSEAENSQSKRFRDHDDNEPSSPSKKCRPEDKAKSIKKNEHEASKNGLNCNTSKNGQNSSYEAKSKNVQCSDSDVSKNGVIHENGKSKNRLVEKGKKGSKRSRDRKRGKISSCNGESSKAQNDSSSVSALSLSASSDSESSDGEGDKEGTERWVEKTKETIGKAKTNPVAQIVHWNGSLKDLSHTIGRDRDNEQSHDRERENFKEPHKRRCGVWDGSRTTEVVDELRRAGNFAYGTKVNTWGGSKSIADHEVERERKELKKRTSDDLYNEEFDSGRTKKIKMVKKTWESQCWDRSIGNEFQKVQDFRNSGSWSPHNHHNHSPYQYPGSHFSDHHQRHLFWDKNRNHYQPRNKSWNRFGKRDHKFHQKPKERYKHWDRRD
ncbi:ubiquitin carboxyl-terminal hydrolase 36 isoform X1 [Procambarus clarkii]|uniref:ubiquitin carboxyl-terminal hydrolase 36 isoform X1 n=1 Tax=Procambarus clarkii TaxID=6728 RepID=UPI0037421D05